LILVLLIYPCQTFSAANTSKQEMLLEVYVNQENSNQLIDCFVDRSNQIWVSSTDLARLRFNVPPGLAPWTHKGQQYYSLNTINGIRYSVDEAKLRLHLNLPLKWSPITQIGRPIPTNEPIRPQLPGLFLNYDVSVQHLGAVSETDLAAFAEVGYFNPLGVGTTDFVVKPQDNQKKFVRLESTWTIDQPEKLTSWYIGDSITSQVAWSGAVRFGGIQYGTNFSTQPYLITFPTPGFAGEAVVPSTLNIFINDTLHLRQDVKRGPFAIFNLPVVTGEGTIKVVTQNQLGRPQEVVIPYYASEQLLKPGLKDYSYEIGVTRENFGLESFDYDRFVAVATYREGLNEDWSAGYHGELVAGQQLFGLSSDYLWRNFLVASTGVALSNSDLGKGGLLLLGLRRISDRLSFGVLGIFSTKYFTELGVVPGQASPNKRVQAYTSYSSPEWGSSGISYTLVYNPDQADFDEYDGLTTLPNSQILTLNYSKGIIKNMYFVASALFDLNNRFNTQAFVSLIWALKDGKNLTATSTYQSGDNQQAIMLNKNPPWGSGYGYHVSAAHGHPNNGDAFLLYQNNYATYSGRVAQWGNYTNYLAEMSGGIIHFGGHTVRSREVYNSFALVELPGLDNVCVYDRNVCIGRTNEDGILLVPNLLPYQLNKVAIEPKDLPLNAKIGAVELEIKPYFRSGVLARFPVKRVFSVSMRLLQRGKQRVMPSGTMVRINGEQEYPVGDNGAFYVESDTPRVVGEARWNGGSCNFALTIPSSNKLLIDLGDVRCSEY
jgi:outer membrane usher protein